MSALMSLWSRLSEIVARLPGVEAASGLFDRVVEAVRATVLPQERREVAFTIAMIALSAKMAKADGIVTSDEVSVVKRLLIVPEAEKANVARLFNLAKQDSAGFEAYATRIEALCHDQPDLLEDVLDGLFVIASADGLVHDRERVFLERVADIFHVSTAAFGRIMARHVKPEETDPTWCSVCRGRRALRTLSAPGAGRWPKAILTDCTRGACRPNASVSPPNASQR